ncbi:hypothetical protein CO115_01840 [Candidatus Falkowbacteria bacterium CG_4_9_14_3_um_filter_36_9]|uniref:Methyltransferase domain-containing protein n=1 Tax=Candidatus Falkowbacteria bacterium CG02_land_8_20_14_3_00_36_14 TaxID=1974560 RepID=A0A2M7DLD3_9BACT|nr:MAG: hypothetical protein COS18_04600 [Candidatus Falkowbacteria bacterium CG02_land_8_20_14_3_00_36_14]PJA11217.1 MAG: hypothetical protein COX67_00935 [Candidatus Falkowbacteria bacterium CG_4_10_14_0_2_um_filter_36_22]PJB20120.1 MAG: hypothetical protein CO115_01840 [Candidatus Falkowbacteria bacterium CG_4_9_14_3_um_filter_36_9]
MTIILSMDKQMQGKLLEIVKRNYEEIADDFNETRKKYLWPELIKLADMVKDDDRILDIGCGNGRLVKTFKDKNVWYLGVDASEKLINVAKKKLKAANFQFKIADIFDLDKIINKKFDYVFCIAVLHHIPGKDLRILALKQLKNKIKPDGKIILTVWNLWRQKRYRKLIIKYSFLKFISKSGLMSRRISRDPDSALRISGDFGDILFAWKNSRGEAVSRRYYHAFTKFGLKKIIKKADLKIAKFYQDKYNYYVILRR